jgi:hypothetical protein
MSQSLQLDHSALRRKRKSRIRFLLIIDNLREQHFRNRRHAAASHLFRITHQLVEMNFRRRDKRADPSPPLHHTFALQGSQCMSRRHQTHGMNLRQVALRGDSVPCAQIAGLDPLPESTLNSLVRWQPVTSTLTFSRHSRSRNLKTAYNESLLSRSHELVQRRKPCSTLVLRWISEPQSCEALPVSAPGAVPERLPGSAPQGACLAAADHPSVI